MTTDTWTTSQPHHRPDPDAPAPLSVVEVARRIASGYYTASKSAVAAARVALLHTPTPTEPPDTYRDEHGEPLRVLAAGPPSWHGSRRARLVVVDTTADDHEAVEEWIERTYAREIRANASIPPGHWAFRLPSGGEVTPSDLVEGVPSVEDAPVVVARLGVAYIAPDGVTWQIRPDVLHPPGVAHVEDGAECAVAEALDAVAVDCGDDAAALALRGADSQLEIVASSR